MSSANVSYEHDPFANRYHSQSTLPMQLDYSLFLVCSIVHKLCSQIYFVLWLAGNSGCGSYSSLYPVYLEYSIGDTSYLLTVLRYRVYHNGMLIMSIKWRFYRATSSPDLYTVQLPSLARAEGVQFSWTQTSGFQANEAVWQLDNVAMLFANQINAALLDTFTRPTLSSSVLFYSSGNIEVSLVIVIDACISMYNTTKFLFAFMSNIKVTKMLLIFYNKNTC